MGPPPERKSYDVVCFFNTDNLSERFCDFPEMPKVDYLAYLSIFAFLSMCTNTTPYVTDGQGHCGHLWVSDGVMCLEISKIACVNKKKEKANKKHKKQLNVH